MIIQDSFMTLVQQTWRKILKNLIPIIWQGNLKISKKKLNTEKDRVIIAMLIINTSFSKVVPQNRNISHE